MRAPPQLLRFTPPHKSPPLETPKFSRNSPKTWDDRFLGTPSLASNRVHIAILQCEIRWQIRSKVSHNFFWRTGKQHEIRLTGILTKLQLWICLRAPCLMLTSGQWCSATSRFFLTISIFEVSETGPNTVSASTVSPTELSEFVGPHRALGRELSELLSA